MTQDGGTVGYPTCIRAIEIVQHIDGKTLCGEHTSRHHYQRISSSRAVQSDYCRKTLAVVLGRVTIKPNRLAAAFEAELGFHNSIHAISNQQSAISNQQSAISNQQSILDACGRAQVRNLERSGEYLLSLGTD